jgi:kinetochore protein NDC80
MRIELANTEKAVAAQNLSPDEVNRMNHERETLTRNLDELRTRIAEASQFVYDQEMAVTKSMDRFEQLLQDYTALGHQIGTIMPLSEIPQPGPGGVDYNLDIDLGLVDLQELQQSGRRMRQVVWPGLTTFREVFRKQVIELGDSAIALEDKHDQLGQKVEGLREKAKNLEIKLNLIHEQAEEAKRVSAVQRFSVQPATTQLTHAATPSGNDRD